MAMNLEQVDVRGMGPTLNQQFLRDRASRLPLRMGVRLAVHAFFHFTHRAKLGEALWCGSERVWMGQRTYLHWALNDAGIDVPWLVAEALDAPEAPAEFKRVIREELIAYWTEQMTSLPRKSTPHWLPLP